MSRVKPEDVEALIQLFDSSSWSEMRVAWRDLDLYLSKDPAGAPGRRGTAEALTAPARAGSGPAPRTLPPAAPEADPGRVEPFIADGLHAVRAPNLGTFYRSPKPGAAPFVEVGQSVEIETEVCIIEVMKLFTAVRAGARGTVRQILVNDAEMVEFNQPLILIEPET